jgi:hypothetical protein
MTCSIERCRAFGAAETRCPAGVSYVGQWSRAVLPAAVTEVLEKIGSARPARRGAPGARSAAHLADSSKAPKSDNKWVLGV